MRMLGQRWLGSIGLAGAFSFTYFVLAYLIILGVRAAGGVGRQKRRAISIRAASEATSQRRWRIGCILPQALSVSISKRSELEWTSLLLMAHRDANRCRLRCRLLGA